MRYARQPTDITAIVPKQVREPVDKKRLTAKKWVKRKKPTVFKKRDNMATALSKLSMKENNLQVEMDREIKRLRDEIKQEKQMKQMLDHSTSELERTIDQLQEKHNSVDDEDNEWKTRYQTQHQINEQLEKQQIMLQNKLENFRESSKTGTRQVQARSYKGLSDADIKKLMKQLDREKIDLQGQLKDLEWRLDNESQSFHKLEENRKKYATELNETRAVIGETKARHRHILSDMQREQESQQWPGNKRFTDKFGLPDNQRIIDPKKGPVKKAATVRKLPKLRNSSGSEESNKSSNGSR